MGSRRIRIPENDRRTAAGAGRVYDGDGNRVSETVGGTTTKFLVDDHNPTGLPQVLDELASRRTVGRQV